MLFKSLSDKSRKAFQAYPRDFWLVVAVYFVDQVGNALVFPFFSLYISQKFNASLTEVGLLFTFFTISNFIGATIGGALTDRMGRKGMIIFGLLATSLSNLAMGFAPSLYACYVIALVLGILSSAGGPASTAIIADLLPEEKRADGFGILRIGFNLAVVFGPILGGLLAARSYLALFIIDASLSSLCALLVFRYLKETYSAPESVEEKESLGATFAGYLTVLKDKAYLLFLLAGLLSWFAYQNMNTTLGVFLRDMRGTSTQDYGLLISLNAVMVILFQLPITNAIRKYKPLVMMAIGNVLYAVGFAMYGFVTSYAMFVLAMVIITIGEMITSPVLTALTTSYAPEHMRGRYLAVSGHVTGLAFGLGPLLAGRIFDSGSPNWMWYSAGILGMLSALMYLGLPGRKTAPVVAVAEPVD